MSPIFPVKMVVGWPVTFERVVVSFEPSKRCCGMLVLRKPKAIWLVTRGFWKKLNRSQKLKLAKAERGAFGFVLRKKLLLGKNTYGFGLFSWLLQKQKQVQKPNQKDP